MGMRTLLKVFHKSLQERTQAVASGCPRSGVHAIDRDQLCVFVLHLTLKMPIFDLKLDCAFWFAIIHCS